MRVDIKRLVAGMGAIAALVMAGVLVNVAGAAEEEAAPELIGAKKCSICHKKEDSGAQHGKWLEGPHAQAFETLASEASVAKAKELGVGNPQEAPECLECHVTAFPVMADLENQKITLEEGVSCESCHGAGGDYWKKSTMEKIFTGEIEGASVGLVAPTKEVCVGCHNENNPFHEEFDFEAMKAQISHPYPEGYREAAK